MTSEKARILCGIRACVSRAWGLRVYALASPGCNEFRCEVLGQPPNDTIAAADGNPGTNETNPGRARLAVVVNPAFTMLLSGLPACSTSSEGGL